VEAAASTGGEVCFGERSDRDEGNNVLGGRG
jgi:hypothetical protein